MVIEGFSVKALRGDPEAGRLTKCHSRVDGSGYRLSLVRGAEVPEIGILLPNNQRQHRTLHIQKDVLPYESS